MTFPCYPDYKDSGVEGLGAVPAHWVFTPIKHLALLNPRKSDFAGDVEQLCSFVPMEKLKTGVVQLDEERPIEEVIGGYTYFEDGDVLQAKVTPCFENKNVAIAKGLTNGIGFGSSEINVLRPYQGVNADYLYYRVQEDSYMSFCTSSMIGAGGLKRVPTEVINNFKIAAPTLCEQTQIARFLAHETARIDALIEEQQRLIELLKEKRQALISHAVTKGLDLTVPMKNSGVEWLGEVPVHWRVGNIKYFLEAIGDVDHYMPQSVDKGIPYVMTGDLMELASDIQFEECKQVAYDDYLKLSGRIKTSKGDVVMARYATIGSVSYVDIDTEFLVSYSCVTIKPDLSKVLGIYLFYYFKSDSFLNGIRAQTNTNTQDNVGVGDIKNLKIALPPAAEQMKIVDYLQSELGRLDAISEVSLSTISLAREKRSALVSAAVTGKIDVRGWQPPISTQAPEFEVAEAL